jgi:hypothetical protein
VHCSECQHWSYTFLLLEPQVVHRHRLYRGQAVVPSAEEFKKKTASWRFGYTWWCLVVHTVKGGDIGRSIFVVVLG